jgi:hypothetical protein
MIPQYPATDKETLRACSKAAREFRHAALSSPARHLAVNTIDRLKGRVQPIAQGEPVESCCSVKPLRDLLRFQSRMRKRSTYACLYRFERIGCSSRNRRYWLHPSRASSGQLLHVALGPTRQVRARSSPQWLITDSRRRAYPKLQTWYQTVIVRGYQRTEV